VAFNATKFGRLHVAEPFSSILRAHHHDGASLAAVAHPPGIPVLDQEDLKAQGIDTAEMIPGAPEADALGSCVANATVAAVSVLPGALGALELALPCSPAAGTAADLEAVAIRLYHALTGLTGEAASEWPPADCGSSGLFACQFLEAHHITGGHKIAAGADNIISLMQSSALITGQPWLTAWMTPDRYGFIDGDGSPEELEAAIAGGIAGGHETCWYGIEALALDGDGHVDADHTIIRFRNSWGTGWGLSGDGLAHLSTFIYLARWCDHRALLPVGGAS
jgi:hypothetical protein